MKKNHVLLLVFFLASTPCLVVAEDDKTSNSLRFNLPAAVLKPVEEALEETHSLIRNANTAVTDLHSKTQTTLEEAQTMIKNFPHNLLHTDIFQRAALAGIGGLTAYQGYEWLRSGTTFVIKSYTPLTDYEILHQGTMYSRGVLNICAGVLTLGVAYFSIFKPRTLLSFFNAN